MRNAIRLVSTVSRERRRTKHQVAFLLALVLLASGPLGSAIAKPWSSTVASTTSDSADPLPIPTRPNLQRALPRTEGPSDLIIQNILVDATGETSSIQVTVLNKGPGRANRSVTELELLGVFGHTLQRFSLPTLPLYPGEIDRLRFEVPLAFPSEVLIKGMADKDNRVHEINESNNIRAQSYLPLDPPIEDDPRISRTGSDQVIQDVHILTEPWIEGQPATILVVLSAQSESRTVMVEARTERHGLPLATAVSDPTELGSPHTTLVNLTLIASRGPLDLKIEVHDLDTGVALDNRSIPVEGSMSLDLPANFYVRVQEGGIERPALDSEITLSRGNLTITPSDGAACCNVKIYRAWLEHQLGSVTSSREWTIKTDEHGSWIESTLPEGGHLSFTHFEPTSKAVFTHGAEGSVHLLHRPMWVDRTQLNVTLAQALANFTLSDTHIAISFTGSELGQPVRFNLGWLRDQDIKYPRFRYLDGAEIPSTLEGSFVIAHAPHFSIIVIDNFECTCVGEAPPGWNPESTGAVFKVEDTNGPSGLQNVKENGASSGVPAWWVKTLTPSIMPTYIKFHASVAPHLDPENAWNRIDLRFGNNPLISVALTAVGSDTIRVSSTGSGGAQDFQRKTWYLIELQSIDWINCRYTVFVDGVLVFNQISFTSGACGSIGAVALGSKGWNSEHWRVDGIAYDSGTLNPTEPPQETFEDGIPNDWEVSGLWHPSQCERHGGTWSARYGLNNGPTNGCPGNFNTGATTFGALTTNQFRVPLEGGKLDFWTFWDTETGASVDQKMVEISVDGSGFAPLLQISDANTPKASWTKKSIDLGSWADHVVQIRFFFNSVNSGSNGGRGWFIDDLNFVPGVNDPPDPCFVVDPSSATGDVTTVFGFDAGCSTDDTTSTGNLVVKWDFGDGVTTGFSATKTITHQYGSPKTYTVTLTVKDLSGKEATQTKQVSVVNRPPQISNNVFTPGAGTEETVFTFFAEYSDLEDTLPRRIRVERSGVFQSMSPFDLDDASTRDGKIYVARVMLGPGNEPYTICAEDSNFEFTCISGLIVPSVQATTYFSNNAESTSGWTATGQWVLSNHAFEGSRSWRAGSDATNSYSGGSGTLTTAPIILCCAGDPVYLSYMSRHDPVWATRVVEIRENSGAWLEVDAATDARDQSTWYPRVADLSNFVGSQIEVRFRFDAPGPNAGSDPNDPVGWLIDMVRIGSDADGDGLPDAVETGVVWELTSSSTMRVPIPDGPGGEVRSDILGIDLLNGIEGRMEAHLTHGRWDDLVIHLVNGDESIACGLWGTGTPNKATVHWDALAERGGARLEVDLLADCGIDLIAFRTHQTWGVRVRDLTATNTGEIDLVRFILTAATLRYESDSDGDTGLDGTELVSSTLSSAVSQDPDDDNLLDPFDHRPMVEDSYPRLNELTGLDGDIRLGVQFLATDNAGIRHVFLTETFRDGGTNTRQLQPGTSGRYEEVWSTPLTNPTVKFRIDTTDISGNLLRYEAEIARDALGNLMNGLEDSTIDLGGAPHGLAETVLIWSTRVQMNPSTPPHVRVVVLVVQIAAGAAFIWEMTHSNENDVTTIDATHELTTFLGSGTLAGVSWDLFEGTFKSGWTRIAGQHGHRWSTPADFIAYLNGRPAADAGVVPVPVPGPGGDDISTLIKHLLIRDTLRDWVISVIVVGGAIADVDVFPVDIDLNLWGEPSLTTEWMLWWLLTFMEGTGSSHRWSSDPPLVVRQDDPDIRRRTNHLHIATIDANTGPEPRREINVETIDATIAEAIEQVIEFNKVINEDAMNTGIAVFGLNEVRRLASRGLEQPADWYWGPQSDASCSHTDRRRCDSFPNPKGGDFFLAGPADDFSKVAVTWPNAGKQDALSVTGLDHFGCSPTPLGSLERLRVAQDGFSEIPGSYDAAIPASIDVGKARAPGFSCVTRTIYLELAPTTAEFKY